MDLEIVSVHGQGKADTEYVILSVKNDCNLKYYLLADTTYTGQDLISNKTRHTFWWYSYEVKKGDMVILLTGAGKDKKTVRDNTAIHSFFWNLKSSVWNDTGDAAVLFKLETWKTTKSI